MNLEESSKFRRAARTLCMPSWILMMYALSTASNSLKGDGQGGPRRDRVRLLMGYVQRQTSTEGGKSFKKAQSSAAQGWSQKMPCLQQRNGTPVVEKQEILNPLPTLGAGLQIDASWRMLFKAALILGKLLTSITGCYCTRPVEYSRDKRVIALEACRKRESAYSQLETHQVVSFQIMV